MTPAAIGISAIIVLAIFVWAIVELRAQAKSEAERARARADALEEVNLAILAYQRGERSWRELSPAARREHRRRMRRQFAKRRLDS